VIAFKVALLLGLACVPNLPFEKAKEKGLLPAGRNPLHLLVPRTRIELVQLRRAEGF
jgi:hypothetical protein